MNGIPRENNFDLIRLICASVVCLFHAHVLSGVPALSPFSSVFAAVHPVQCFFVISGILITGSWDRSKSVSDFAVRRLRRVYPAYVLSIVGFACLLSLFSIHGARDYFFSFDFARYLGWNALFLNFLKPSLPGVFSGNPEQAVNGALWTLKVEVMFYCAVPVLAWLFGRFNRLVLIVGLYLASCVYLVLFVHLSRETGRGVYAELARQLPGQMSYCLSGALVFFHFEFFRKHAKFCLIAGLAAYVLSFRFEWLIFVKPMGLALVVFFVAYCLPLLSRIKLPGDYSYGIFIFHYPIVQIAVAKGYFKDGDPWLVSLAALATAFSLAVLSWHGLEKRFTKRSSHPVSTISSNRVNLNA
ncbi:MAG: acyltransferase [Deltaproteobacteria bacterium]|nr:acyltransferase [Deltaproteobacteria bacterium]